MKYTVLWSQSAENDLAQIWLEAENRDAVTKAAEVLDGSLRSNAH